MEAADWIKGTAAASLYPAQIETTLTRLSSAWPPELPDLRKTIEDFPLGQEALLRLLALSS
ncbi:MAG: hypothetical protein DME57_09070, partial [Verrucomicrobia bacterium]